MFDTDPTGPHLDGIPEPAPATPPAGYRGKEQQATAGEVRARGAIDGGGGRAIVLGASSGIAAAETRGTDPHSADR